tara:strand:+ start:27004 stop:27540 length:537 start_codon:yes stop_codon:yes gene_type:complete
MEGSLDRSQIDEIAVAVEVILGTKLIQLKRRASGALINSFQHTINIPNEFDLSIDIKGLDYWKIVQYGVNPSAIPYSPNNRSGADSSLYIEGLMRWIKIKGIASDSKVIRGIAFAIARKQTGQSGGGGKGNPMDKSKLDFIGKTQSDREQEVKKIGEVYNKSIFTMIKSLTGGVEIII